MGALSEQELAAFSADFNKNDKNKVHLVLLVEMDYLKHHLMMKFQNV